MIEFVETPDGLMTKRDAERIATAKTDARKALHEALDDRTERRARARNLNMRDVQALASTPFDTLRRAAEAAREKFTPAELERAYPCRSCAVVMNDVYRQYCYTSGALPCFVEARHRGCGQWKAKAIITGG